MPRRPVIPAKSDDAGHLSGPSVKPGDPRALAAFLLAEGRRTYSQIAEDCGVHRDTLWAWRKDAVFQAEVRAAGETIWADLKGPARAALMDILRTGNVSEKLQAVDRVLGLGEFQVEVIAPGGSMGATGGATILPADTPNWRDHIPRKKRDE